MTCTEHNQQSPTEDLSRQEGQANGRRRACGSGVVRAAAIRCFTLLELMLAMAVFLLVVMALVGFSSEVTKSWGRLHGEQRRFAQLLALDRTVDNILTNVVPFTWVDEDNQPLPAFFGESDRVLLAYLRGHTQTDDGGMRFVGLSVVDTELVAMYQHRPVLDWEKELDIADTSVLARDVSEVRFWYASADEEGELEWLDEWDPELGDLPLAILMQVFWEDGREESWLRRTSGNGFRERWGKWTPNAVGGGTGAAPPR